jgi:hypothetical protein
MYFKIYLFEIAHNKMKCEILHFLDITNTSNLIKKTYLHPGTCKPPI